MATGQQAVQHYQQRQRQALEALDWYEQIKQQTQDLGRRFKAELEAAAAELARAYLPALDAASIDRVERLTGFVAFKRRDPLKAMAHKRQVLEHGVARIRADERYVKRDMLAGPDGTLGAELAQAREMIEPFRAECARFEELDGFLELLNVKYDTPEHSEEWWQAEYWKHWQAGDLVCKELGMDDFGDDVLPAYHKVASQRAFWQAEIASLEARIGEVHGLVQQHDEAVASIGRLPRFYLEQCHELLGKHLAEADVKLLAEWLDKDGGDDRGARMGLRKLSGLRAKFDFLQELHNQGVESITKDLHGRVDKYSRKITKFNRPKNYWRPIGPADLDPKFDEQYEKLRQLAVKLRTTIARVERFDDYGRFDLDNDPNLWWHAFTGGKRPPRLMPRLRRYYDRNPTAQPIYDDSFAGAVAEAARDAAAADDDVDYMS